MLPGTEMRGGDPPPFWSPDSKFLAFDAGGKLKKVDLTGSPPVTICSTSAIVLGGAWSRQGVIIFGNDKGGLMRVPEKGGNAVPLTTIDRTRGERAQGFPTILPDGRHFIYSRFSSVAENSGVYVGSLDTQPGEQGLKQVVATPYAAQFVPQPNGNGRLLFLRDGTVWAQDLDTSRFELSGEPMPVAESVGDFMGLGFFAASPEGTMVYRNPGSATLTNGLVRPPREATGFGRRSDALGLAGCFAGWDTDRAAAIRRKQDEFVDVRSGAQ